VYPPGKARGGRRPVDHGAVLPEAGHDAVDEVPQVRLCCVAPFLIGTPVPDGVIDAVDALPILRKATGLLYFQVA
jgi:hypothetical protein